MLPTVRQTDINMNIKHCDIEVNLKQLIEPLLDLEWASLPTEIQNKTSLIFADDLTAILAASNEVELQQFIEKIVETSGRPESTIFNSKFNHVDKYTAALANGASASWCELDSGYLPAVCHAGIYCLPSILAAGEAEGNTIEEMLCAFLFGYEVIARIARMFSYEKLVLHPHGSLAAIGSAATLGFLRKYSKEEIFEGINTAATMVTPGPFQHAIEGGLVRNIWSGLGASNGLRSMDLIRFGISGTSTGLFNVFGEIFNAKIDARHLIPEHEVKWAVLDSYHKKFACCQYSHSAVEATQIALSKLDSNLKFSEIKSLKIRTHWKGKLLSNISPKTTLAAKFSMEHILGTTVYHGTADSAAFHLNTLENPDIRKLREKVIISGYEPEPIWPNDRPANVTIEFSDGTSASGECLVAEGSATRPFAQKQIAAKITNILSEMHPNLLASLLSIISLNESTLKTKWSCLVNSY